jgi:hypothetical protein
MSEPSESKPVFNMTSFKHISTSCGSMK